MIRLLAVLCCGIFLVLLIEGQDRGQVRQGLLAKPLEPRATVTVALSPVVAEPVQPQAATPVVFVPAQPVMAAPPPPEPAVTTAAPEPVADGPATETWAYVDARSVNVRSGPSTADGVIDRLTRGEAVLVVAQEAPVDGWTLVRIEGDGVQGYIADRFLTAQEP